MSNTKKLSSYAFRMARLKAQIHGEVTLPTDKKSMRIVTMFSELPHHKNSEVVDYYPRHQENEQLIRKLRDYGIFRDEHLDFKEEMYRLKVLRGKSKPERGKGKQALLRASD
ncbi:hypothetical protein SNEBB_006784 [Seison nebaliae]|nr:hypothetical protein SNEBB_006784 [Seison nebaliae]